MRKFGITFKRLMIFSASMVVLVNLLQTVSAETDTEANAANIDLLWMLICAVLVFMMQAGFMCLESGIIRNKNNINSSQGLHIHTAREFTPYRPILS